MLGCTVVALYGLECCCMHPLAVGTWIRIEVNANLTGRALGRQGDGAEVWEQSENMQLPLGSIPLLFSLDPPL